MNKKLEKRISDGFYFTQYASIIFDYNRERLAKLMALSSRIQGAPVLHVHFELKDPEAKRRELIAIAYEDARLKAEALASAANENLRDCVRVDIDKTTSGNVAYYGADGAVGRARTGRTPGQDDDFSETLQLIDETFKPNDIYLNKSIDCVWETSN